MEKRSRPFRFVSRLQRIAQIIGFFDLIFWTVNSMMGLILLYFSIINGHFGVISVQKEDESFLTFFTNEFRSQLEKEIILTQFLNDFLEFTLIIVCLALHFHQNIYILSGSSERELEDIYFWIIYNPYLMTICGFTVIWSAYNHSPFVFFYTLWFGYKVLAIWYVKKFWLELRTEKDRINSIKNKHYDYSIEISKIKNRLSALYL